MKLIIFPGTFNPLHLGHLMIAENVKNRLSPCKIVFIPSFNPPHRTKDLASSDDRMEMLKLATASNPDFLISDIEYNSEEKSYSIKTVKALYRENPDLKEKINFIIGSDAFYKIDTWYKAEELSSLVKFIVILRPGSENDFGSDFSRFNFCVFNDLFIDISSTLIRENIENKKPIKNFVTKEVKDYILKNGLYL